MKKFICLVCMKIHLMMLIQTQVICGMKQIGVLIILVIMILWVGITQNMVGSIVVFMVMA